MAYMKIANLYRDVSILEFKQVWALEKIHGTSAHIRWKDNTLKFFSGGEKYARFIELFDHDALAAKFPTITQQDVIVFGEAHGGKCQGMRDTYGDQLRFVAFEVKIDTCWLAVPQAAAFVEELELEFVHHVLISTDIESINAARDDISVQAIRNGMGEGHKQEGIVLRPPFEVNLNNGNRLIAKHKRDDFRETKTRRQVGVDSVVLTEAQEIADEWVTEMRLIHVLDKLPKAIGMEHTPDVVRAMLADILLEGSGEFEMTKIARKAVGRATVALWKQWAQRRMQSTKQS